MQAPLTVLAEQLAVSFSAQDLASQADSWPESDQMTGFARSEFDPARSGDATLFPKPGVLMRWDPGRGTGHGSRYELDTHVPLIFPGGPFAPGRIEADTTPYGLGPTPSPGPPVQSRPK